MSAGIKRANSAIAYYIYKKIMIMADRPLRR